RGSHCRAGGPCGVVGLTPGRPSRRVAPQPVRPCVPPSATLLRGDPGAPARDGGVTTVRNHRLPFVQCTAKTVRTMYEEEVRHTNVITASASSAVHAGIRAVG